MARFFFFCDDLTLNCRFQKDSNYLVVVVCQKIML